MSFRIRQAIGALVDDSVKDVTVLDTRSPQEKEAARRFKEKPKKELERLMHEGVIARDPQAVSNFLLHHPGLDDAAIGDYVGDGCMTSQLYGRPALQRCSSTLSRPSRTPCPCVLSTSVCFSFRQGPLLQEGSGLHGRDL